jgi:hypothetical protein
MGHFSGGDTAGTFSQPHSCPLIAQTTTNLIMRPCLPTLLFRTTWTSVPTEEAVAWTDIGTFIHTNG